jgi:hypothetical protein
VLAVADFNGFTRLTGLARLTQDGLARPPHPAFNEQLQVRRAALVPAEAMVERVPEPIQTEVVRAPGVGPVQKRTVNDAI